jgi:pseudouridine kinase
MSPSGFSSIACVGGTSIDRRVVTSDPLRPGTSNPVVSTLKPGGVSRNVAEVLARLGCDVALFSIVGEDDAGRRLLSGLAGAGVDIAGVIRSKRRPTGAYTAVLGPSGRLEFGLADMEIFEEADAAWAESLAPALSAHGIWFVDANLSADALSSLLASKPIGTTVLADPVSVAKSERLWPVLSGIDVLFPDRLEAGALSKMPAVFNEEQVAGAAERILEKGVGTVVVTLGPEGIFVADGARGEVVPAIEPHGLLSDVTGAGDALVAGYIFGLSGKRGDPLQLGLAAASLALEDGGDLSRLSADRVIPALDRIGRTSVAVALSALTRSGS